MAADDAIRLFALWMLVHESADEALKASLERGRQAGPGGMDAGPDAFVDGLVALVSEEKDRLKAELAVRGAAAGGADGANARAETLDELRFEIGELRGRIDEMAGRLETLIAKLDAADARDG